MIYRHRAQFYPAFRHALRPRAAHERRYPRLTAWARRTVWLVRRVRAAADAVGISRDVRAAHTLEIDRRLMPLETILSTIRYHARTEYPALLKAGIEHNLTAIYATNLNDRYLVLRLNEAEVLQDERVQAALAALRDHLDGIPREAPED